MNILFLCHRLPFPPNKGDKIGSHNILEFLRKRHNVYLGTFIDDPDDYRYLPIVREKVSDQCKILPRSGWVAKARMLKALLTGEALSTACFYSTDLQKWVNDLCRERKIDRVVIFGTAMAPYLLRTPDFDARHVIYNMIDIDSDKWTQYSAASVGPLRLLYSREAKKLFSLEREATQTFGSTLLVSDFEKNGFIDLAPETASKLGTARNGVDMEYFSPNIVSTTPFDPSIVPIVMTGMMDYRPNIEGARWFAKEVMPFVLSFIPNAHFYAVGAKPPSALKSLENKNVTVTGRVEDVRPYIAHASVVVAPLHMARGVQNKVLEAMAMQKPVIATTAATRALDVKSGGELWIADSAADFAATIAKAVDVNSREETKKVAHRARKHIENNYSWDHNLAIFERLINGAPPGEDHRHNDGIPALSENILDNLLEARHG